MVRPAGLEPAAFWFEARHSIQLRYGRFKNRENEKLIEKHLEAKLQKSVEITLLHCFFQVG